VDERFWCLDGRDKASVGFSFSFLLTNWFFISLAPRCLSTVSLQVRSTSTVPLSILLLWDFFLNDERAFESGWWE
jgi:hypothetical protein